MGQIVRKQLFALLIIPMLLVPMAGLSYAHFTGSVVKKYKLHVCGPQIEIKNYTIVTSCWLKRVIKVSPPIGELPTDTISISSKIFPCWFVWIGLVLHNQGCIPAKVNVSEYIIDDPDDVWKWFKHKEFFYGPYTEEELEAVRDKVWDHRVWWRMPPKCVTPTEPPITLQPCQRLVLWIKLKFKPPTCCGCWCKCFKIKISIKITAEPPELIEDSCWTWPPT